MQKLHMEHGTQEAETKTKTKKKRNHQAQLLNNNAEQFNVFAALSCMQIE